MHLQRPISSTKTKVFLVDDHPIVRQTFEMLIALERDMMGCGQADSAPYALEKIQRSNPEVAVVDLSLRGSTGIELIKQLHRLFPQLKILVFSMHDEGLYAERVLRAGASGYLSKEAGAEKAIEAIRKVTQGKIYISEPLSATLVRKVLGTGSPTLPNPVETLTDREPKVLELLGNGLGSRDVAQTLRLSLKTVESHREHIKAKLGLHGASDLAKFAFDWIHRTSDA